MNTEDKDVVKFLKWFTFLDHEKLNALEKEVTENPGQRNAQRILAEEVTSFIHGKAANDRAVQVSEALFYGDLKDLSGAEIEDCFSDVPSYALDGDVEIGLLDLLIAAKISPSRRQAREDIQAGAIYVNGERCAEMDRVLRQADGLAGSYLVMRRGKRKVTLVKWSG